MAFHPTPNATAAADPLPSTPYNSTYASSTVTDTCGYCGVEFANPPDWDSRIEHLNNVHKFGECNQNKKFFRADHFRQHLKHSHAGTSGRWTNVLETACVKDEPLPQPLHHMAVAAQGMQSIALQSPLQMAGLGAGQPLGPIHIQHGLPPHSQLAYSQQSLPPQQSLHHQSKPQQQQQQALHPPPLQQIPISQQQHISRSTKDDPT